MKLFDVYTTYAHELLSTLKANDLKNFQVIKTYHFSPTVLRSSCGRGLEPFSTESGFKFTNEPFLYYLTAVEYLAIIE